MCQIVSSQEERERERERESGSRRLKFREWTVEDDSTKGIRLCKEDFTYAVVTVRL
jgi:hypothetical protein